MERTITLVWDDQLDGWRDKHSGEKIEVIPPAMTLEPTPDHRGGSETVHQHFAELFQSGHYPFATSFVVTYEQVQEMVNTAIEARTSQLSTMAYFAPPDDNLVTYGAIRDDIVSLYSTIARANWRIEQLERPWYKRWFGR